MATTSPAWSVSSLSGTKYGGSGWPRPRPWPEWVGKSWSSPSDAKWPRTAASTSRAGRAGLQAGLARLQGPDARLEQARAGGASARRRRRTCW